MSTEKQQLIGEIMNIVDNDERWDHLIEAECAKDNTFSMHLGFPYTEHMEINSFEGFLNRFDVKSLNTIKNRLLHFSVEKILNKSKDMYDAMDMLFYKMCCDTSYPEIIEMNGESYCAFHCNRYVSHSENQSYYVRSQGVAPDKDGKFRYPSRTKTDRWIGELLKDLKDLEDYNEVCNIVKLSNFLITADTPVGVMELYEKDKEAFEKFLGFDPVKDTGIRAEDRTEFECKPSGITYNITSLWCTIARLHMFGGRMYVITANAALSVDIPKVILKSKKVSWAVLYLYSLALLQLVGIRFAGDRDQFVGVTNARIRSSEPVMPFGYYSFSHREFLMLQFKKQFSFSRKAFEALDRIISSDEGGDSIGHFMMD